MGAVFVGKKSKILVRRLTLEGAGVKLRRCEAMMMNQRLIHFCFRSFGSENLKIASKVFLGILIQEWKQSLMWTGEVNMAIYGQ